MANCRILWDNLWKRPTSAVVATSSATALPAAASQNPQRTYVWRSLSQTNSQALDIDLGSAQAVTCIAVANVRLLNGQVLKLQHRGDAGAPGTAVDVATLPTQDVDSRVAVVFFASQSHRHWRLLWTHTGGADYGEVGYVHLGTYWTAAVNFSVPSDLGFADPSVATTSLDGQKDFVARTGVHTASLRFATVAETQKQEIRDIFRAVGVRTPIFTVLDPALASTHWLARFASEVKHPFEVAPGRYSVTADIEEAR